MRIYRKSFQQKELRKTLIKFYKVKANLLLNYNCEKQKINRSD